MDATESAFFEAVFPAPIRLLGLRLQPFSLGHRILLHRFGSALVVGRGAEPFSYDDLAISVFICHHTYEAACDAISAPDLDEVMADWEMRLERPTWLHRIGIKKPRVIDLQTNSARFLRYVSDGSKIPDYAYSPDKCGGIDAPFEQVILSAMIAETNLTLSEILNMPYSLLCHIWLTKKACAGQIQLMAKDTIDDAMEAGKAMYDKLVADGVIKPEVTSA